MPLIRDGGQAFSSAAIGGMSLRDYFAGQALIGMLAANQALTIDKPAPFALVADAAYRYADAMLTERQK